VSKIIRNACLCKANLQRTVGRVLVSNTTNDSLLAAALGCPKSQLDCRIAAKCWVQAHQLGIEAGHEEASRLEDGVRRPARDVCQEQHLLPVPQAGNDLQHDQSDTIESRARTKSQPLSSSRKSYLSPPGAAACSAIPPGTAAVLQTLQATHDSQLPATETGCISSQEPSTGSAP
jgi:hypothetical protein